jgi:hypothetical protein
VLATQQTAHERNISLVSSDGCRTLWLRTCYDLDLAERRLTAAGIDVGVGTEEGVPDTGLVPAGQKLRTNR